MNDLYWSEFFLDTYITTRDILSETVILWIEIFNSVYENW